MSTVMKSGLRVFMGPSKFKRERSEWFVKSAAGRLSLHSSMQTVCPWIEHPDVLDLALNPAAKQVCFALKMGLSTHNPEAHAPTSTRHRDNPPESGPEPMQQRSRIGSKVNHHRTRKPT